MMQAETAFQAVAAATVGFCCAQSSTHLLLLEMLLLARWLTHIFTPCRSHLAGLAGRQKGPNDQRNKG
jgi:hypothetical protein